ncbi:hypothetical protein HAX54_006731 [Datura stramonium]|uniref:Uncharacterized protein n=1 Tax=Datura stramonium TaxID=4076 RepID=A0ABS8TC03_DATST|nr:hypothetical protein [Datura stramonium]
MGCSAEDSEVEPCDGVSDDATLVKRAGDKVGANAVSFLVARTNTPHCLHPGIETYVLWPCHPLVVHFSVRLVLCFHGEGGSEQCSDFFSDHES